MVRNRSPARTEIFVNKANSFGFSHSKAKGFNAVYGHFRLVNKFVPLATNVYYDVIRVVDDYL
ncbi:MAG: hypothetical protein ACI9FJ_002454 [Alteromonadaceae bacterium]|jgi:hypothetical protein